MDLLQNVTGAPRDGEAIDTLSHSLQPIDMHQARLHAIKVSSRPFGWGPVNMSDAKSRARAANFFLQAPPSI